MNYWLVKSEPSVYSFEQLLKDKNTIWEGVRNFAARNNLKAMKKNDKVLFYHSNEGKDVVGIAKVAKEYYQDPTTDDTNWVVVDLAPVEKLKKTVTLEAMKKEPSLKEMQLIRIGRLSVCALTEKEYNKVLEMGGSK